VCVCVWGGGGWKDLKDRMFFATTVLRHMTYPNANSASFEYAFYFQSLPGLRLFSSFSPQFQHSFSHHISIQLNTLFGHPRSSFVLNIHGYINPFCSPILLLLLQHPFILFLHFVSFRSSIFALLKQSISTAGNLFSLPSYAVHNS